ncbi:MAG: DUF2934 domain-containing protein [Chthoniobacterales bacterium]
MPRKPKSPAAPATPENTMMPSTNGKATTPAAKKKTRSATSGKPKKSPAAKTAAPKPARQTSSKPANEPTDEQIRLRAYFLAERRHKLSLPGDSNHDWIEARRQLIEEAKR